MTTNGTPVTAALPATSAEATAGARRFGVRSVLALLVVLGGVVPFLALWLLVQQRWSPLAALDGEVAAELNSVVSRHPALVDALRLVTDLGGTGTAVLVLALTTAFLAIRHQRRLAVFVAVTGLGLGVLVPTTKALADRARPVVTDPVVAVPSNASFPSGHAMTSLVTWGVLLLLALPAVRRRAGPWMVAAVGVLVLTVGFTRLALGVHFVSDVLAGWALGTAWLAATTAAFRVWQHERSASPGEPLDPLEVSPAEARHLAPSGEDALPGGRTGVLRLAGAALGLFAVLSAVGLLVTGPLSDTVVGRVDRAVPVEFVELRTATWTVVAEAVSTLGATRTVIGGGLVLAVLAMAATNSRRPAVFVVLVMTGEVAVYFCTALVVGRLRPQVADLTSGLPTGASWPSGHVAASTALYGALAALVITSTRLRRRWLVLAVPLLVAPAVGVSRIYLAAHHPTDVVAGLFLGTCWVMACTAVVLLPARARTGPASVTRPSPAPAPGPPGVTTP